MQNRLILESGLAHYIVGLAMEIEYKAHRTFFYIHFLFSSTFLEIVFIGDEVNSFPLYILYTLFVSILNFY